MKLDSFPAAVATAVLMWFAPAVARAQLPSAAELMAAHNQAIGGEAAFAKYDILHSTGTFSIPAAGLTGGMESYRVRPNTVVTYAAIPGMGELRGGFNGEVAWAVDPIQGARLLGGPELQVLREQAVFAEGLRYPQDFSSAETVEKTTLGGQECYQVKLVWKSGRESFECYSPTSHLLIARMDVQDNTELGRIEALTLLEDYRDFGGIRLPARLVTTAMEMEQVITIEKVDFVMPDAARLALPAEVQALIRK